MTDLTLDSPLEFTNFGVPLSFTMVSVSLIGILEREERIIFKISDEESSFDGKLYK